MCVKARLCLAVFVIVWMCVVVCVCEIVGVYACMCACDVVGWHQHGWLFACMTSQFVVRVSMCAWLIVFC